MTYNEADYNSIQYADAPDYNSVDYQSPQEMRTTIIVQPKATPRRNADFAPPSGWRLAIAEPPEMTKVTASGMAVHSRHVLVRQDGRFFVAQMWCRVRDSASCWIPSHTTIHVPVYEEDVWMDLSELPQ